MKRRKGRCGRTKKVKLVPIGKSKKPYVITKPRFVEESNIFGLKNMLESLPPAVKDRFLYNTRF